MSRAHIKYVIRIFLLVITVLFVTDKVFYVVLNKISDRVYTGQTIGKLNQYLKIKDSLDFIVFGSSRASHSIDPTAIAANGYNMGVDATLIAYSSILIKLLPKHKKQVVFFHIDPNSAFSTDYNGSDVDELLTKYHRNNIIQREIDKLGQSKGLQGFFWSIGYNSSVLGIIKNFFYPKYNYKNYSGYDPIYTTENQRKIFGRIVKNKKPISCDKDLTLNKIYESYLDELKLFSNNKELIIFTSPEYNDQCKDDNVKFKQIMKQKGLRYYDFTDLFKENNSLTYWKDNSHLSNEGAEMFTDSIKRILYKENPIMVLSSNQ